MRRALAALALVAGVASLAAGQSLRFGSRAHPVESNPTYDGQFTFVRLRYGPPLRMVNQRVPWSHDYPDGERHFMQIMNEITNLHPKFAESSVMGFVKGPQSAHKEPDSRRDHGVVDGINLGAHVGA